MKYPLAVVYLAGPIQDCTPEQARAWRHELAQRLHRMSYFILDPCRRALHHEIDPPHAIVEADKADIDACDILIAHCPTPSVGTSMEILYAWQQQKHVLLYIPAGAPISPWLHYHSHAIHDHPDGIVQALTRTP